MLDRYEDGDVSMAKDICSVAVIFALLVTCMTQNYIVDVISVMWLK